jgi:hypothetical protein
MEKDSQGATDVGRNRRQRTRGKARAAFLRPFPTQSMSLVEGGQSGSKKHVQGPNPGQGGVVRRALSKKEMPASHFRMFRSITRWTRKSGSRRLQGLLEGRYESFVSSSRNGEVVGGHKGSVYGRVLLGVLQTPQWVPELDPEISGYKSQKCRVPPRITKVTLNMGGRGKRVADKKVLEHAISDMGQDRWPRKPRLRPKGPAKSIAGFQDSYRAIRSAAWWDAAAVPRHVSSFIGPVWWTVGAAREVP